MRTVFACLVILGLCTVAPVRAQDPDGCGKFAWPLARERAVLTASGIAKVQVGDTLAAWPEAALLIQLDSGSGAAFARTPERKPRHADWFGGTVHLPAPPKPGLYQITVSADAWVDVIQDGEFVHSAGSTGRSDCPGARKSVRLPLDTTSVILQFSDVTSPSIAVVIAPVQ